MEMQPVPHHSLERELLDESRLSTPMYSKSIQTIKRSLQSFRGATPREFLLSLMLRGTRWGSIYHMLLKYLKLLPFLPQCAFCDAKKEFFLTNDEDKDIRLLCDQLKEVEISLKKRTSLR